MSMAHLRGGMEAMNERLRGIRSRLHEAAFQFDGKPGESDKPSDKNAFPETFEGRMDEQFYFMSNIIDDLSNRLGVIEAFTGTGAQPAAPAPPAVARSSL